MEGEGGRRSPFILELMQIMKDMKGSIVDKVILSLEAMGHARPVQLRIGGYFAETLGVPFGCWWNRSQLNDVDLHDEYGQLGQIVQLIQPFEVLYETCHVAVRFMGVAFQIFSRL